MQMHFLANKKSFRLILVKSKYIKQILFRTYQLIASTVLTNIMKKIH